MKQENLEEMTELLYSYNLAKLNQKDLDSLKRPMSIEEI